MSDMKCPFCQQKLVRHWGMKEPILYCCDNPKCSRGGVATESSWQELIRTRKALEIGVDALKTSRDCAVITSVARGLEPKEDEINIAVTKALEQITALEKKV